MLILKLYNDNVFYENCASYAIKRSKHFDINIMVDKYIVEYKKLIEKEK